MNEDFDKIEDFEVSQQIEETNKISIIKECTASINVDPEKGFTPLCPNELPVPGGDEIVEELNGQNSKCKYKIVTKDVHPYNALWNATLMYPQLTPVGLPNVDVRWNRHCESGTKGMELLDGLPKMTEYDFFVAKGFEADLHPYSACYHDLNKTISTGIIEWLNQHEITTVIVGGLALNVEDNPLCVGHTVIDLANSGFQVILNLGAVRGLGSKDGQDKFVEMLKTNHGIFVVNSYKDIEIL